MSKSTKAGSGKSVESLLPDLQEFTSRVQAVTPTAEVTTTAREAAAVGPDLVALGDSLWDSSCVLEAAMSRLEELRTIDKVDYDEGGRINRVLRVALGKIEEGAAAVACGPLTRYGADFLEIGGSLWDSACVLQAAMSRLDELRTTDKVDYDEAGRVKRVLGVALAIIEDGASALAEIPLSRTGAEVAP